MVYVIHVNLFFSATCFSDHIHNTFLCINFAISKT